MGPPVVYLHVGAPKTGTTHLQHTLHRNRSALREAGVLYPGTSPAHYRAALDLIEAPWELHESPQVAGAWTRLVTELRRWNGPAVVSHESLAKAAPRHVERARRDLSFAEVHVVYTARDLARQLPAGWQERVKNGETMCYGDFLAAVQAPPSGRGRGVSLRSQDVVGVLRRWGRDVPPERVHVLTLPPPGSPRELLWHRFAGIIGVDATRLPASTDRPNESLGAVEAEALRRANQVIAELDVPRVRQVRVIKDVLVPQLSRRDGTPIALPEPAYEWALRSSHRVVEQIRQAGWSVVGDLDELVPGPRREGALPDELDCTELATEIGAIAMRLVTDEAQRRSPLGAVYRGYGRFRARRAVRRGG